MRLTNTNTTTLIATLYAVLLSFAYAESKLKSFERSATGKSRPSSSSNSSSNNNSSSNTSSDDDDDDGQYYSDDHFYHNTLFGRFFRAGHESYAAVTPDDVEYVAPYDYARELGSPRIPFIRVDWDYQEVDSTIESMNYRLEGGYGPIALQVKRSEYEDDGEDPSQLDITQWHVLYRMSLSPQIELDVGVGSMELDGGFKTSGASITLPIAYHAPKYFSLEVRPAWADFEESNITDISVAGLLSIKHVSLRGGYRWTEAGGVDLDGAFGGVSFQW